MNSREAIDEGLKHATAARSPREAFIARCLYDELSNQWSGRGLTHQGGGGGDGLHIVVVSGSVDLVALAQRALRAADEWSRVSGRKAQP